VAAVDAHAVVQGGLALLGLLVTRVGQPAVRLQQDGRAQVLLAVPPVRGARGRAARAQDALVQAIEFPALLGGLAVLKALFVTESESVTSGSINRAAGDLHPATWSRAGGRA